MHYSLGYDFYNRRTFIIISIILIIILIIIGLVRRNNNEEEVSASPDETVEPIDTISPQSKADVPEISVYNHDTNQRENMSIEEYIVFSVAGEMPASFNIEALKAQAIACRTLAYQKQGKGTSCNGCDICTDSSHGQGYLNQNEMYEIWGDDYDKWLNIIKESVVSTSGQIITYNNQPIEVMYHASSNGMTESSGNFLCK